MKLFIWKRVGGVTANWHDEGGVVVVAESVERARELLAKEPGVRVQESRDGDRCGAFDSDPDLVFECKPGEAVDCAVILFPDAGCC